MDTIKPIQRKLIEKRYLKKEGNDYIYGNSTIEIVRKFQKKNGLKDNELGGTEKQNEFFLV